MYRVRLMKNVLSPVKRKIIQLITFVLYNPHVKNFADGRLYTGKWKNFCSPGLNCYSCPAAALSCPIGAMQAVSGSMDFKFSFYVTGFLLALGVLFGRTVCAFLCPFGLLQELLHKIPSAKFKLPSWTKYIKYVLLLVFVLILPVASTNFAGVGDPAFCKYICPQGTLEGGIPHLLLHEELRSVTGSLFFVKIAILFITLIACIFVMRFFCKVLCPLGAIYGLCNKFSLLALRVDSDKCVKCGKCASVCPMDVDPVKNVASAECIRCSSCVYFCPTNAIKLSLKEGRNVHT